jgi:hypothetical protein
VSSKSGFTLVNAGCMSLWSLVEVEKSVLSYYEVDELLSLVELFWSECEFGRSCIL